MNIFKTSINVKYDIGNTIFYDRYIPTAAHSEVLKGIINGINNEGNRSHIAIGPYGTGKSLITTLIAGIVAHKIDEKTLYNLANKFNKSDEEIYSKLIKLKDSVELIPIIINGAEGNFEETLLKRIFEELDKNDLRIKSAYVDVNIIDTINEWQVKYPLIFYSLRCLLDESPYKDVDNLIELIKSNNDEAIDWFIKIYPSITGRTFSNFANINVISVLEEVTDVLEKKNKGLFIIYDEFGRYLQTLSEKEIYRTMGLLQDLAEFIDHKSNHNNLLLITHKHLSNYFSRYDEDFKNEFNRIEKRYQIYYIKNDQETFFDIANNIISSYNIVSYTDDYVNNQKSMLRKFNLFDYNQTVIENKIIKGCYPIHPVAVYLLTKLSELYGQNERTLFTFLESRDSGGFVNHIEKENSYYLPYELFDYFFVNIDLDLTPEKVKKFGKLERRISEKNPNKSILLNILKFFTLWEETNSNTLQKLTIPFINYAFNDNVEEYIEELKSLKLIRYNYIYQKLELFEGSLVDINLVVDKMKKTIPISNEDKINLINSLMYRKYYYSEEYNHMYSITRYSKNIIITSEHFLKSTYELFKDDADIYIYYIININDYYQEVKNKIIQIKHNFIIFCVADINIQNFDDLINKWFCLNCLAKDREFYMQDVNLKDEISIEQRDVEYKLSQAINNIMSFNTKQEWFYNGNAINITSEISISKFISEIFKKLYKYTPEIKNDMFNRRHITVQQLNAAKKLVDSIIKNPLSENFGINGTGPDYLIYATVFKNNNYLPNGKISKISDNGLKELYNRVIRLIGIKQKKSFKELIDIFTNPPFGIRKPVIPVLLTGILKNKWNYIMFFGKGSFIPNVNADTLYDMIEHPEDFEFIVFEYDQSYNKFFESMITIYQDYMDIQLMGKPLHIKVAAAMLKWLQSLPKITQTTNNLDEKLLQFRNNLRQIEIDPYRIFFKLRNIFLEDESIILSYKNQLDEYFNKYKISLQMKVHRIIKLDNLHEWVKLHIIKYPKNLLLKTLENSNYEIDNNKLSEELIGVSLYDWTEVTEKIFFNELDKQLKEIKKVEYDPEKHMKITIDNQVLILHKNIELSSKAKLIDTNIKRIIDTQGKFITKEELDFVIYSLIIKYLS